MKNRIRVLRAERQWSQAELAERVGVSRNSINSVESVKTTRRCRWRFASAMCSA
jgi:putative transcriptional regulator